MSWRVKDIQNSSSSVLRKPQEILSDQGLDDDAQCLMLYQGMVEIAAEVGRLRARCGRIGTIPVSIAAMAMLSFDLADCRPEKLFCTLHLQMLVLDCSAKWL